MPLFDDEALRLVPLAGDVDAGDQAAMPPDALHSASAMATTAAIDTPMLLALTIDVSWNTRKSWTSAGRDSPRSSTWRVTSSGFETRP